MLGVAPVRATKSDQNRRAYCQIGAECYAMLCLAVSVVYTVRICQPTRSGLLWRQQVGCGQQVGCYYFAVTRMSLDIVRGYSVDMTTVLRRHLCITIPVPYTELKPVNVTHRGLLCLSSGIPAYPSQLRSSFTIHLSTCAAVKCAWSPPPPRCLTVTVGPVWDLAHIPLTT